MKLMTTRFRLTFFTVALIVGVFVSSISAYAASVVISNVASTNVTANSATITWTTDKPSNSQVSYGLDLNHEVSTPLDSTEVTNHSVIITGLLSGSKYVYSASSNQPAISGG